MHRQHDAHWQRRLERLEERLDRLDERLERFR
jgi:hypothetical protein